LIANLSDISYVETGRLKLNFKPTAPSAAIEDALLTLQPKIQEKKLALQIDAPAELPNVLADPARLTQVLSNLLTNALMYTPEGGSISVAAIASEGAVRFEIHDSGIGISEADQQKLFTPFFRSDDEAVRELQGWGLALHISHLLIQAQGGQIGAQSQLKTGSTFWFTLPVHT
jgi:signal transduction histidine kinase